MGQHPSEKQFVCDTLFHRPRPAMPWQHIPDTAGIWRIIS
jgi:hypothetical protein